MQYADSETWFMVSLDDAWGGHLPTPFAFDTISLRATPFAALTTLAKPVTPSTATASITQAITGAGTSS
jgi:hypothetical protein